MVKQKFQYARPYKDRHGKRRWRFRHNRVTAELGTTYGSHDFMQKYENAMTKAQGGIVVGIARTKPRTIDDLVARFYALHFPTIGESTRSNYRAVIEPFREKHGGKKVADLRVPHLLKIKADMAGTPSQANKLMKRLSQMMDLAVELEWRPANPVKAIKAFPINSGGFHTWDEGEIEQFLKVHSFGNPAHRAMTLMLYTGAAKCDAVNLGKHSVKNGRLTYRRNKTKKNPNGILIDIPVHPELQRVIDSIPDAFTFLETRSNKARSVKGLGTSMRKWCNKAKLPLCSSHGLRKAICRRIAEAQGTPHEIMSVSGHITLSEAQKYCETFGRKALSDSAFDKMESTKTERKVTNLPARFVKKAIN